MRRGILGGLSGTAPDQIESLVSFFACVARNNNYDYGMVSSTTPNREEMAYREYLAAAAAALEAIEAEEEARHICDYCPCHKVHTVTFLVGFTPGRDECRACPEHVREVPPEAPLLVAVLVFALSNRPVVETSGVEAA